MDCEVVLLIYYLATLAMAGWILNIYSNRMLNDSRLNPIPEDMMENYNSDDSDDAHSEHSSEALSEEEQEEEREWGGEEQPTEEITQTQPEPQAEPEPEPEPQTEAQPQPEQKEARRGRRRKRNAWSRIVNESTQ